MNRLKIPEAFLQKISEQAECDYPSETCGMIFAPLGQPHQLRTLRPCRNVQDEYHAKDPVTFPRTSRTAYFMDPRELLAIQKETRSAGEIVRIIYHSHIDAGAYFSEEDTRIALCEGEPAYPGVDYLVVSVIQGRSQDIRLFSWSERERKFV